MGDFKSLSMCVHVWGMWGWKASASCQQLDGWFGNMCRSGRNGQWLFYLTGLELEVRHEKVEEEGGEEQQQVMLGAFFTSSLAAVTAGEKRQQRGELTLKPMERNAEVETLKFTISALLIMWGQGLTMDTISWE